MTDKAFKTTLFFVLLAIFFATAVLVLCSLGGWVKIDPKYQNWMFSILIVEVVSSVFAFWKQLTAVSFSDPPDVSGKWKYECIRTDANYKHGGWCVITLRKAPHGWEFTIYGQRTWEADKIDGKWERKELEAPAAWENNWGTFTGRETMHYGYSIKSGNSTVDGYGWASVKPDKRGKVVKMEGNFFQLPPYDPILGFQSFERLHESTNAANTHER